MEVNVTPLPLNSREITPLTNEERGEWDLRAGLDFLEVRKTFSTHRDSNTRPSST